MSVAYTCSGIPNNSHANPSTYDLTRFQSGTYAQRAGVGRCVAAQRDGAGESDSWLRSQLAELHETIAGSIRTGKAHRWPLDRVVAAQQAILAGDEHWRMRAAEAVLR